MITEKNVARTIYLSLIMQLTTTIISLDGLNYNVDDKDYVLREILILEAFVQFVEAFFYIWVIFALKDLKIMTSRRYIDWFITTPTMLVSTIVFFEYLNNKSKTIRIVDFIKENKEDVLKIFLYNFMMLLFGLLGELNIIDNKTGVAVGFIFFYLTFKLIYDKYAYKTEEGMKLYKFLVIIWSLYGVAALMPLKAKNISYNMLDIVSKNFYGLFIYYTIRKL
jgi:hypothetical protein